MSENKRTKIHSILFRLKTQSKDTSVFFIQNKEVFIPKNGLLVFIKLLLIDFGSKLSINVTSFSKSSHLLNF